jgi:hypothetical protein
MADLKRLASEVEILAARVEGMANALVQFGEMSAELIVMTEALGHEIGEIKARMAEVGLWRVDDGT